MVGRSVKFNSVISIYILISMMCIVMISCDKDDSVSVEPSSIKIITSVNEPKQVEMGISNGGAVLAYTSSGDEVIPLVHQEFFLLNASGDILKTFGLSDTLFQHISVIRGIDNGFFVVGSANTFPYIALFKVNDSGEVEWSKTFQVKFGTSKNKAAVIESRNGEYWVMHQSQGSGYYIWRGDLMGNEIGNKKFEEKLIKLFKLFKFPRTLAKESIIRFPINFQPPEYY